MIVCVLFVHKKSVSKRKVCIIFIKKLNKKIKTFFVDFLGVFLGEFLLPTLSGIHVPWTASRRRRQRQKRRLRNIFSHGCVRVGDVEGGGGSGPGTACCGHCLPPATCGSEGGDSAGGRHGSPSLWSEALREPAGTHGTAFGRYGTVGICPER